MPCRARGAFTLLEMLIALAGAALVVGVLLPVLNPLRHQARRSTCSGNLAAIGTALTSYVEGAKGIYPGSFAPPEHSAPFWMDLLGGPGLRLDKAPPNTRGDYTTPAAARPLNPYLGKAQVTACCPLDRGDSWTPYYGPASTIYGSSYAYPNRDYSEIAQDRPVVVNGVWAAEGRRREEVRYPTRKVLVADLGLRAERPKEDGRNNWHGTAPLPPELAANAAWARALRPPGTDPAAPLLELKINMLFGDGHVAEDFRREDGDSRSIHPDAKEAEVRKLEQSRYY